MRRIASRPLSRDELERFLDAAQGSPFFKGAAPASGRLTLVRPRLPALVGYRFNEFSNIDIQWTGSYEAGLAREFFAAIPDCEGHASYLMTSLEVAESGTPYDAAESSDLKVSCGFNQFGPAIRIAEGAVSPGFQDLCYRRRLFNEILETLGLLDRLEVKLDGGVLQLDVKDPGLLFPRQPGLRPSDYDRRNRNLVRVDAARLDMSNFHDLILNVFGTDELEARFTSIVNRLGVEKISAMAVGVLCREDGYGPIRDRLNASPFTPWEIGINVESAFTLSDLEHAVAHYSSFFIHGFEFRVPKAGAMSVYIAYDQDEFSIDFQFRPSPNRKRDERLESAITEVTIAAGVGDFIVTST